jgi:hypothetical protein
MAQFENPHRDFSASPDENRKLISDAWAQPVPGIFDDRIVRDRMVQLIVKVMRGHSGRSQPSYWHRYGISTRSNSQLPSSL